MVIKFNNINFTQFNRTGFWKAVQRSMRIAIYLPSRLGIDREKSFLVYIATDNGCAAELNFTDIADPQLYENLRALSPIFEIFRNPKIVKIVNNRKIFQDLLEYCGTDCSDNIFDIAGVAGLIDPKRSSVSVENLAVQYGYVGGANPWRLSRAERVVAMLFLHNEFRARIVEQGLISRDVLELMASHDS